MDDDYVNSADMAEQALSQAVDEHIENSKEAISHIEGLEEKIKTWNMEDIREFKLMITEMRALLQKQFQVQIENFMNMSRIPTQKVPDVLKQAYKIICVDKRGYALYGHDMDKIAHIKKIAEHYKQRQVACKQSPKAEK
ncbi:MAG: hypothetical protein V1862_11000 [Methanobacteriota archaeon]